MGSAFFGLNPSDKEAVILEPIFLLTYHMKNIDYATAYNMPIAYKRWFIERLSKEKEREAEAAKGDSSPQREASPFANTPFKDNFSTQAPSNNPNSKRFR